MKRNIDEIKDVEFKGTNGTAKCAFDVTKAHMGGKKLQTSNISYSLAII
jgi:hypothetical protein